MTFEEKRQWAYGFASLVVPAAYLVWLAGRVADAATIADVSYVRALLWAIGAGIVVNMIGSALVRGASRNADLKDQRDLEIARRGDTVGFIAFSILIVGPFVLAMRDADTFWIANAIYVSYVLTAVLTATVKATLNRKGI